MKVLLKSDGKTVLFLSDSATLNANDEMWQMLDVACETPLIDGRESLWVVFQNVAEPTLLSIESMLERCEDGHYRILFPDGVIAVPGEWTFQLFMRTYDTVNEKWANRIASDLCDFTVSNGLPISGEDKVTKTTIAALHAEAVQKIQAESKNAENITAQGRAISDNKDSIDVHTTAITALKKSVNTGLGAKLGLSYDPLEHIIKIALLNQVGEALSVANFDLPLESVVVGGAYDDTTKSVVLTLQNGETVSFPVGDLVNGLISSTEKGQPNGVATLGADGKVPSDQLPAGQGGVPDLSEYVKITDRDTFVKGGVTENTETLTDEEKTSACDWLGAVKQLPTAASGEKGKLYSNKYNNSTQGYDVQVDGYSQAGKFSVPTRASNGAIYIPDTACVADGAIPEGQVAVNANYVDENAGTKWYKHTIEHVVDGIGIFDLLIVSTRNTAYTSGEEIYSDWVSGKINSFFDSSLGSMSIQVCSINDAEGWHATLGINADGYGLAVGTYTDNFESL